MFDKHHHKRDPGGKFYSFVKSIRRMKLACVKRSLSGRTYGWPRARRLWVRGRMGGSKGRRTWCWSSMTDWKRTWSAEAQRPKKSKGGLEHTPQVTARRRVAWRRSLSASENCPTNKVWRKEGGRLVWPDTRR